MSYRKVEVIVITEGPTEEKFIKTIIAPALNPLQIFVKPQTLPTSRVARGGSLNFDRLKFHARNTWRQNPHQILTTLLDLYGLETDFPEYEASQNISDIYARVAFLEQAMHQTLLQEIGCRSEQLIPYIQPHEFEGLLFSDVAALCQVEDLWRNKLKDLQTVRADFPTSEHINNSYASKPSKRLENILSPKYRKTLHGPRIAAQISLEKIEAECHHFHAWLNQLRNLASM